ncbi:hypothetical protein VQ056_22565 [Paenibacillus sp. JTLBN-2024]
MNKKQEQAVVGCIGRCMNKSLGEWMNKPLGEWMNKLLSGLMNQSMNGSNKRWQTAARFIYTRTPAMKRKPSFARWSCGRCSAAARNGRRGRFCSAAGGSTRIAARF